MKRVGEGAESVGTADERRKALYQAVVGLKSVEECERFFEDLCTPTEVEAMADRWLVAGLVDRGVPYREIHDRTGVSTATVTRVGRALKLGADGYRLALGRLARKGRKR